MSVVAGVSLLNGVLIGADCRVTYGEGDKRTHRDTCLKLIPLGSHTVIGFTGWIQPAAKLLLELLKARGTRTSVQLEQWLPRFFKRQYKPLDQLKSVSFIVASILPNRLNFVSKADIAGAASDAVHSRPRGGINTVSRTYLDILRGPGDGVATKGQVHLWSMNSPNFRPVFCKPMRSVAIGSGEKMNDQILQVTDQIHFDDFGEHKDVTWFGRSMDHFLRAHDEITVGGMFTIVKITAAGILPFGRKRIGITHPTAHELVFDNDRWVQRNLNTGEEIKLSYPWEIDEQVRTDRRFDGVRPLPVPKNSE